MNRETKKDRVGETPAEYKSKVMEYPVVIHRSRYGYDVVCPVLPGCASQGDTADEAIGNIKSAIHEYLEAVRKVKKGERLMMVEVAV